MLCFFNLLDTSVAGIYFRFRFEIRPRVFRYCFLNNWNGGWDDRSVNVIA